MLPHTLTHAFHTAISNILHICRDFHIECFVGNRTALSNMEAHL